MDKAYVSKVTVESSIGIYVLSIYFHCFQYDDSVNIINIYKVDKSSAFLLLLKLALS